MLAPIDLPPELEDLHRQSKEAAAALLQALDGGGEVRRFATGEDLLRQLEAGLFFVDDGFLQLKRRQRVVRYLGRGDLLHVRPPMLDFELAGDWPSAGRFVAERDLLDAIGRDPSARERWLTSVALEQRLLQALCAQYAEVEVNVHPELRRYAAGEALMQDGQACREVQVLIEGEAQVYVDGVQIATVGTGEFIGEIAFLTGAGQHKATVIAATPCLAHVITGEDFERMIRQRPHTIAALARTLAERLVRANDDLARSRACAR